MPPQSQDSKWKVWIFARDVSATKAKVVRGKQPLFPLGQLAFGAEVPENLKDAGVFQVPFALTSNSPSGLVVLLGDEDEEAVRDIAQVAKSLELELTQPEVATGQGFRNIFSYIMCFDLRCSALLWNVLCVAVACCGLDLACALKLCVMVFV